MAKNLGFSDGNSLYLFSVRNSLLDKLTTSEFFVDIYIKIHRYKKNPKLPYSIFLEKSLSSCLFFVFNYFVKLPCYF